MKRLLCIILCFSTLFLSACGIYNEYSDTEKLLVAETLGLDSIPGGIRVSCASSMGGEGLTLTGVGETVEAALDNIQKRYMGRRLFVRHCTHIIIGEETARNGIEDILEYICRSPEMRIDTPVYILRGQSASKLMESAGELTDTMAGISESSKQSLSFTASDILSDMLRSSGALVCVLEASRPSEKASELTVSLSGCAVIKNYRLCAFLDEGETLGAAFLMGNVYNGTLTVTDSRTGTVTLAVTGGGSSIIPIYDESGELTGISVGAELKGTVSEIDGGVAVGSASYMRRLTELTEELVSEKINSVLRLTASLGTDFLALGESSGVGSELAQSLGTLETQVRVSALLSHTNDMRDGV